MQIGERKIQVFSGNSCDRPARGVLACAGRAEQECKPETTLVEVGCHADPLQPAGAEHLAVLMAGCCYKSARVMNTLFGSSV